MFDLLQVVTTAYVSNCNTAETIAHYRAMGLQDSKAILSRFTEDCMKAGCWRLKRQVTDSQSDSLAGWKACKAAGENILSVQPGNTRAQELVGAAVLYNRISTMLAAEKAASKKPTPVEEQAPAPVVEEQVIKAILPKDCPATTVWDLPVPAIVFPVSLKREQVVTQSHLAEILSKASEKSSKSQLLNIIEQLRLAIA